MKKESHLANEIKKLQYQLSYAEHMSTQSQLRCLDKEMGNELSLLVEKLHTSVVKIKPGENIPEVNLKVHLEELFYVEPLFMAYRDKIQILEEEMNQMKEDAEGLNKYAETIVGENNFLRKELENKNKYILKCDQVGISINFLKLENSTLGEKISLFQEKNEFLLQKLKELTDTVEKQKQAQLKPNQKSNAITLQLSEERQKSKDIEMKYLQASRNLDVVSNQLGNEKTMTRTLQKKVTDLQNDLLRLRNEMKLSKQQLESVELASQNKIHNLELQIQSLKSQLTVSQRRENELFNKSMLLEGEVQDKNSKCHNLALQNSQLQANNNSMLQMLQTYEVKVNSQAKRVKALETELKEIQQGKNNHLKEFQMAEWKLSEKQRELELKEKEWKKERERMNKMWEDRIGTMKSALSEEKESLLHEIEKLRSHPRKNDI